MMGMTGMCESMTAPPAMIKQMEGMMPKLYKNPQDGPCADAAKAKCQTQYGMTICTVSPTYGDHEDTAEFLHEQATEAMWGGKGHKWAHSDVDRDGRKYCMQVHSDKVADDAKWREQGSKWAKKHGDKIEDGKCGEEWKKVLHHRAGKHMSVTVFGQ